MYGVLIVEDERIEREGLARFIDWSEYGLTLLGTAKDAYEALEKAEETEPDILISDIKMPGMNGIELLEQVRERLPETEALFISGYDDFSYAQGALRLRAQEYLLKPVNELQFIRAIESVVATVRKKREAARRREEFQKQAAQDAKRVREEFYRRLLRGDTEVLNDSNAATFSGELLSFEEYNVHYGRRIVPSEEAPATGQALSEDSRHIMLAAPDAEADLVVISESRTPPEALRFAAAYVWGSGESVTAPSDVAVSYHTARRLAHAKRFFARDGSFDRAAFRSAQYEYQRARSSVSAELNDLAARISNAVRLGDRDASAERFAGFVDAISRYPGMPREQVNGYVALVVNLASQVLSDGTYADDGKTPVAETINAVRSADRLQVVAELITRLLEQHASRVSVRHGDRDRALADRVSEFVTERYAEPLSLQLLADEIGMSANYVGSVFRSVTGIGFTDYLNEVRMNKARELLGPHARINEVARAVGVPNASYFCVLFRKAFGLSPGEYRDSARLRAGG